MRLTNEIGQKATRFLLAARVQFFVMDTFLHFMTSDTTLFGISIHNWIIALAGFVVIWGGCSH